MMDVKCCYLSVSDITDYNIQYVTLCLCYVIISGIRMIIDSETQIYIYYIFGPSQKLKPEGKGLDQSRTLNSHSTTTTNFSTSSRIDMQLKVSILF